MASLFPTTMTDPTLCQPLRLAEPITGGPFRRGGRFSPATWRKFSVQLASLIRYMQFGKRFLKEFKEHAVAEPVLYVEVRFKNGAVVLSPPCIAKYLVEAPCKICELNVLWAKLHPPAHFFVCQHLFGFSLHIVWQSPSSERSLSSFCSPTSWTLAMVLSLPHWYIFVAPHMANDL